MNKNRTDMIIVVDRSGSMTGQEMEASSGINRLIEEQTELDGECWLTLVEFDNEASTVYHNILLNKQTEIKPYVLTPRGMTGLCDAVGSTIKTVGRRLSDMDESERPGLVIFCIVTDGHENASKIYTKDDIRRMIKTQTDEYNWQFTFLAAGEQAFQDAQSYGVSKDSMVQYTSNQQVYTASIGKFSRMREEATSGGIVCNSFTENERKIAESNINENE